MSEPDTGRLPSETWSSTAWVVAGWAFERQQLSKMVSDTQTWEYSKTAVTWISCSSALDPTAKRPQGPERLQERHLAALLPILTLAVFMARWTRQLPLTMMSLIEQSISHAGGYGPFPFEL